MNEQCLDHYCAKYHLLRKLTQRDPENTDWRRGLSVTHGQLAYVLEDKGDLRAAVTQYERNLELLETLTAIDPANIDWQIGLGRTQLELAGALRLVGRLADSAEKKHQCIASARRLIPLAGENADPQFLLADALDSLGELLRLEGRHTDALAFLGEARALRNKLAPLGKTPPRQRARIRGLLSEAESALADSKLDLARQLAIEASELVAPLLAGNSSELENQQCAAMVAYLQARLGESNDLAGRLDVVAESLAGQNLIRHLKVLAKGYQQLGRERELRAVMERILPLGCRDPEIVQIGRSLAMDVSPPVKEPDALNPCLRR
jgi:tetratricopeptide (TPR) repeat protein